MTCETVRIKSDAPGGYTVINATDRLPEHTLYVAPPPLPPAPLGLPAGQLANLPKDWRNGKTPWLLETAEKVSGRAPENRAQAVQMIEAALSGK